MLLGFDFLIKKYNLKINGVIHIGAHYGAEYNNYVKNEIHDMVFFEASKKNYDVLIKNIKKSDNILMFNYALGSKSGKATLHVESANRGMSNSILKPKKHLNQYKRIVFNTTEEVDMIRLDDAKIDFSKYNFINIDVQGYELEVFKGSEKTLKNIDYIMSEVNNDELYENNVMVSDLDKYLSSFKFKRVETNWAGKTWGDALYIKEK